MKRFILSIAAAGLLALGLSSTGLLAQVVGPPVTQTASRADAAMFLQSQVAPATTCSTINTSTANATVTITPPAGLYAYITGVYIDLTTDATGTTDVATLSTTNITGAPFWSLATLAVATAAGSNARQIAEVYATPLKATVPGTAVTFVPSAQLAHTILCIRVAGYFAP